MTAHGHARAVFRRAIERGNLLVAETEARGMGRVSLVEALELTALIARKDPRRRGRAGARWLRRYLETNEDAGIDELALAAGALAALGGAAHEAAYGALLELAERARRHSDA